MKQEQAEKIDRYIKGIADDSEREFVESLLSDGESNPHLHNCLEKDWNLFIDQKTSSEADLTHMLDRIHHIIRKNETRISRKPIQRIISIYMKAAAIMLIPLMVAGGLIYSHLTDSKNVFKEENVAMQIYAPMGSRVSFNLPDGTTGMLNSGSKLDYSVPFTTHRNVKLEGEAWFAVTRDPENPFMISAGNSTVKVLGTSFNLSAYPAENYIELVLDEGKVEFLGNNNEEKVTILPEERLIYHNGQTGKTVVDPDKYSAWTEGKLVFRGDPMAEVARRIERWYNVKIRLADKELEKYSFRATFEDDKLEDVLRFLAMTSPISYQISPRELMADSTLTKEEVTIYKKNR